MRKGGLCAWAPDDASKHCTLLIPKRDFTRDDIHIEISIDTKYAGGDTVSIDELRREMEKILADDEYDEVTLHGDIHVKRYTKSTSEKERLAVIDRMHQKQEAEEREEMREKEAERARLTAQRGQVPEQIELVAPLKAASMYRECLRLAFEGILPNDKLMYVRRDCKTGKWIPTAGNVSQRKEGTRLAEKVWTGMSKKHRHAVDMDVEKSNA